MTKETFIFRLQWWRALQTLPEKDRIQMMDCIADYVEYEKEPDLPSYAMLFFDNIRQSLDSSNERYRAKVDNDRRYQLQRKRCDVVCSCCAFAMSCDRKDVFRRSGRCEKKTVTDSCMHRLQMCVSCSFLSECKRAKRYVKDDLAGDCIKFVKSPNTSDSDYCYVKSDNDNDVLDVKKTSLSSPSKEKEKGGDGAGGTSFVVDKEKVLARCEQRGIEMEFAKGVFDDLEAMDFRIANQPVTSVIEYIMSRWQKHQKIVEAEAAQKAAEEAVAKRRSRSSAKSVVPKECADVMADIKASVKAKGTKSEFVDVFELIGVTKSTITIRVPSFAALETYSKTSDKLFFDLLSQHFEGKEVKYVV